MKEIFDDIKSKIWKDDRILAYQQFAQENDFRLVERERFGTQAINLKAFKLFKGKRGKRLKGVLYKPNPNSALKTRIYDYNYYSDSKTKVHTVIEFFLPQWSFSEVLIRPKSSLSKMKDFFSKPFLLFEGLYLFHKKYQIYSPTPELLKYELNEEFLELLSEQQKLWMEARGNFLIFYFKNKPLPLNKLLDRYEYVLELLDALLHGHSNEEYV